MAYSKAEIDLFLEQYFVDLNAKQAILRCGFTTNERSANSMGWAMLQRQDVREEVDRRISEKKAKAKITVDRIEEMLREIAELDPLDIFKADGTLRDLAEWPPAARRAVKSIETTESFMGETTLKVTFWDKKAAIELLGKYKKMFTDSVDLTSGGKPLNVKFLFEGVTDGRG